MELHYNTYGEAGRPLIILHGLLGASGNWHTLGSKAFGERFRVFAVDQRNHGRSPHSDAFDYTVMAEDLEGFMARHGLESAYLLGHSMGGKTAMHFALTRPEQVDRLVVVDIAPKAYPPHHTELFEALRALDLSAYTSRKEIDQALARRIASPAVRQFLLKNLQYNTDNGYRWQMNLEGIYGGYGAISEGLEGGHAFEKPALFVRGGQSDYIVDEDEADIRRFFPQAEIITIAEAGHWVHAEAPEAFAEVVLDFLD